MRSTRTPSRSTRRNVPSLDPSSTTRMSAPGTSARTSARTDGRLAASLCAGISTSRSSTPMNVMPSEGWRRVPGPRAHAVMRSRGPPAQTADGPHGHRRHPRRVARQMEEGKGQGCGVPESQRRREHPRPRARGSERPTSTHAARHPLERGQSSLRSLRPTNAAASTTGWTIMVGGDTESPVNRRLCRATRSIRP